MTVTSPLETGIVKCGECAVRNVEVHAFKETLKGIALLIGKGSRAKADKDKHFFNEE